MLDINMKIKSH